ncbi:acyl carrier protein [Micromonospora chokoriensis]|uniref:acyl carrier protein n=1 Tax=Micromonospora chokoriensis TaxID=356851 RepID=UPI0005633FF6|nr:acyl carrier protein [Micromonospora chokoriensis]
MSSSTTNQHILSPGSICGKLTAFLERQTKRDIEPDLDIFAAGLVSSLFALELVVHIESTFDVAIGGPDLRLDNFRTVDRMTELVLRLRGESDD